MLFDFELEQPRLRIHCLDRPREHDAAPMEKARAEDERGGLAARRIDDDVFDDADAGAVRLHAEALGSREPVLEHVATPAEHIRPHTLWVRTPCVFETSEDAECAGPRDRFGT